ncbi:MAG: [ribosomal protein S5]-alanine N-acetyltransferase [Clostridiales bacterium]|jgi:ribosomal-protein-alanine N-acetyltransferase|nr:[ribosomal protein S5]-alanine N-acetyltransferase [Clostridiales bacterium]MDN5283432.1 [ribosomal protein S5]-alanine N-acetyltransferase [Candidatus Ozemobacter sp.]
MFVTEIPSIKTERFLLTVLRPEEAELIHKYYLENRNRLAPVEPERNEDFYTLDSWRGRLIASYTNFKCGTAVNFVALSHDRSKMLAGCNFTGIVMGPLRACYLGYSVDKDHEGTGLMFEVVSAGIKHIFEKVKLHRIMANYMPENERSANLLKKLGFEREGFARSYLKIAGRWRDHVLNSLLNPDPEL